MAAAAGWGKPTGAVDTGSSGPCWMGYWNSYIVDLFSVLMSGVSYACFADIAFVIVIYNKAILERQYSVILTLLCFCVRMA